MEWQCKYTVASQKFDSSELIFAQHATFPPTPGTARFFISASFLVVHF